MKEKVLISGGSRGLGREMVQLLFSEGWQVATFSRTMEPDYLENEDGGTLLSMKGDIRLDADVNAVLKETLSKIGEPTILVLNAGTISKKESIARDNLLNLRRDLDVNVIGSTYLMQKFLAFRSARVVIHITSDVSMNAYPGWGFYAASKRAMDHIIDTAKLEETNVKFLSIDPGDMFTQMHLVADPEADQKELADPKVAAKSVVSKIMEVLQ